jgi:predicted Fe-Mo cluster-binding NifX family protein
MSSFVVGFLMTIYAVPVRSGEGITSQVSDHFGMSEFFVIIDGEGDRIASSRVVHCALDSEDKKAADLVADHGVEVVLAGRIGSCMMRVLFDRGVRIYSGAEGTAKEAFESLNAGALREMKPSPYAL